MRQHKTHLVWVLVISLLKIQFTTSAPAASLDLTNLGYLPAWVVPDSSSEPERTLQTAATPLAKPVLQAPTVAPKPLIRIIQTPRTVQVVAKPVVPVVIKPAVPGVVQKAVVQAPAPVTPVTQVRKVITKTITRTPTVAPKAIKVKVGVPKIAKGESSSIADKIKSLMEAADQQYSKGNGEVEKPKKKPKKLSKKDKQTKTQLTSIENILKKKKSKGGSNAQAIKIGIEGLLKSEKSERLREDTLKLVAHAKLLFKYNHAISDKKKKVKLLKECLAKLKAQLVKLRIPADVEYKKFLKAKNNVTGTYNAAVESTLDNKEHSTKMSLLNSKKKKILAEQFLENSDGKILDFKTALKKSELRHKNKLKNYEKWVENMRKVTEASEGKWESQIKVWMSAMFKALKSTCSIKKKDSDAPSRRLMMKLKNLALSDTEKFNWANNDSEIDSDDKKIAERSLYKLRMLQDVEDIPKYDKYFSKKFKPSLKVLEIKEKISEVMIKICTLLKSKRELKKEKNSKSKSNKLVKINKVIDTVRKYLSKSNKKIKAQLETQFKLWVKKGKSLLTKSEKWAKKAKSDAEKEFKKNQKEISSDLKDHKKMAADYKKIMPLLKVKGGKVMEEIEEDGKKYRKKKEAFLKKYIVGVMTKYKLGSKPEAQTKKAVKPKKKKSKTSKKADERRALSMRNLRLKVKRAIRRERRASVSSPMKRKLKAIVREMLEETTHKKVKSTRARKLRISKARKFRLAKARKSRARKLRLAKARKLRLAKARKLGHRSHKGLRVSDKTKLRHLVQRVKSNKHLKDLINVLRFIN